VQLHCSRARPAPIYGQGPCAGPGAKPCPASAFLSSVARCSVIAPTRAHRLARASMRAACRPAPRSGRRTPLRAAASAAVVRKLRASPTVRPRGGPVRDCAAALDTSELVLCILRGDTESVTLNGYLLLMM
jgi:hypothetical protein